MCKTKTNLFQLIEIAVTAASTQRIYLGDQPQLRQQAGQTISILKILTYPPAVMSVTPSGATPAPVTELAKATLVLYSESEEKVFQLPLLSLVEAQNASSPFVDEVTEFDSLKVDFAKSYIQMGSAVAGAPYSFALGISYKRF